MIDVIQAIQPRVPDESARRVIYADIMDAFEQMDCDTLDEAQGIDPAYDAVFRERYANEDDEFFEDLISRHGNVDGALDELLDYGPEEED
jgi:hypothetical protein